MWGCKQRKKTWNLRNITSEKAQWECLPAGELCNRARKQLFFDVMGRDVRGIREKYLYEESVFHPILF